MMTNMQEVVWVVLYIPRGRSTNSFVVLTRDKGEGEPWKLPGGRIEAGENDDLALAREMQEELPGTGYGYAEYIGTVVGLHPRRGVTESFAIYAASLSPEVRGGSSLTAAAELAEARSMRLWEALGETNGVVYRALRLFDAWYATKMNIATQ